VATSEKPSAKYAVLPTPERLDSHKGYTGKGITIAYLDSGFYPHPDLVEPENRILAYYDCSGSGDFLDKDRKPEFWHWHGGQTSVVAAGNGSLSGGVYRSLAPDSKLVLVQVGLNGRIRDELIAAGIRWVIQHREQYNIRVVNISVGGWEDNNAGSFAESEISLAAEEAVDAGLVVVVAAGNDGDAPRPPANAPSVLTVGGLVTQNLASLDNITLYNSNFGFTSDLVVKPEVIAPAAWVAAPLLPNTLQRTRTDFLLDIEGLPDEELIEKVKGLPGEFAMPADLHTKPAAEIRAAIDKFLRMDKVVGRGYQHVDGTSFAAPIVASIVAQMLEANPALSPAAVRQILMSTADRVRNASVLRQGCGVVNARRAVEEALRVWTPTQISELRPPRVDGDRLSFIYVNPLAESVHLVGDVNGWNASSHPMEQVLDGLWRIDIEAPGVGRYRYKFLIDGKSWAEDPANLFKQPNIYGGFDSILTLA
jgi:serine protease AprX